MKEDVRTVIRRLSVLGAVLLASLCAAPAAQAQTTGGWTLNIDNTGYNPIPAGALLPYSVRIDNNDNVATPATTITFAIPATAEFVGVSGLNNCVPVPAPGQPATVTCDVPVLGPGSVLSGTVNLRPTVEGTISLSGTIPNPGPSFSRQTTVQKGADLSVDLVADPATVQAGSIASFTATVGNAGPYDANGATLVVTLPVGLSSEVTMPAGCSVAAGTITCAIAGPIAVGGTIELDFAAQVTAANASTITLAAEINTTSPRDGVNANDGATADITVTPGTDVSIGQSRAPLGLILVGDTVTFTLDPRFVGAAPTSASISDVMPANYQILSVVPTAASGWTCPAPTGQTIGCSYAAAGGTNYTAPITVTARAISATSPTVGVTNVATISSPSENAGAGANNSGNDGQAFIAVPTIDLVARKSGPSLGLGTVGNSYEFRLNTRNDGNAGFSGPLTITDHLPAGLTLTGAALPNGWSCLPALPLVGGPGVDFTCSTAIYTPASPLAPTQQTDVIVLTAEVTAAGSISNGMTVSFPNYNAGGDVEPGNNSTSSGLTTADGPNWADVSVVKTMTAPPTINSGDAVTFEIEIVNSGPASALNVVLDDRLNDIVATAGGGAPGPNDVVINEQPGAASGLSCSTPTSSGYSRDLQCVIDTLPACTAGADCPRVSVTVRTGSQGAKTNTATAFSTVTPDNNTANNSDSVGYSVVSRTDVTVAKSSPASSTGANAGQELIYVLTASVPANGLSDANDVTITDTLPAGLVFNSAVPSSGSCSVMPSIGTITGPGNATLTCELGGISNGSQQTVSVRATPTTALVNTSIFNTVAVSTSTDEPDQANNQADLTLNVLPPQLDLIISVTDGPDPVEINTDTTYTITVRNSGPSDAFNLVIVDTLPLAGLANPRVVTFPPGAVCNLTGHSPTMPGGTLSCTLASLAANSQVQITMAMEGIQRGRHTNNVSVTSDETTGGFEAPIDNNTSYEDTTVRERADVAVTKVPSKAIVDLREEFSWTITVTNQPGAGLGVAEWVTLVDTLPVGMELTRAPVSSVGTCSGAVGGRQVSCELGDMAPAAVATVTLWTKITSTVAGAADNSATASTLSFDKVPANNTGTGQVTTVLGSNISGTLYRDFNGNDIKGAEDTGINGITMSATGIAFHDGATITATTTTDASGDYSFQTLPPGTYSVSYGTIGEQHLIDGKALPGPNENAPNPTANGVNRIDGIVITSTFASVDQDFSRVPVPRIGIGKVAGTIARQTDGSYFIPYTLTVKNLSLEPINNIVVSDVLNGASQNFGTYSGGGAPAEGQYRIVSVSGGAFGTLDSGFTGAGSNTLVSGGTLAAGASGTITYTVHVSPNLPRVVPALVHTNQASVDGSGQNSGAAVTDISHNNADPDPNNNGIANEPANNTPTTVTPGASASVTLVKTATPSLSGGGAAVGDRIDYGFTVTNTGNTPLLNVLVTDPLPNLQGLSTTPIARLDPGQSDSTSFSAHYFLTQADIDNGSRPNTATVSGQWGVNNGTPVNATATDSETVPALSNPGLTLLKALESAADIGNPRTEVGDIVRYRFTVTNTGNTTLNNVTVSDALPGVVADPVGSFSIGTLAPSASTTVYANYPVTQGNIDAGTADNSATASAVHGPGNTPISSSPSTVQTPLFRQSGLTFSKTLASTIPAVPRAGTMVSWTTTAVNTGNVTLTNLVVTDPFPGATVSPASLASLAPGASANFTVTAPLRQIDINAGEVENTATINYGDPTGPQPPVDDTETFTLPPQSPDIALQKTGDVSGLSNPPKVGEQIVYTITIRNTGNVPLDTITLADLLADVVIDPADVTRLNAAVLQPQNQAGTVPTADTDIVVTARYGLKQSDIDAGSIVNTAVTTGISTIDPGATVTDQGGTTFGTDDPTTTSLAQQPQISLIKTITTAALSTPPQVGDVITYAFSVHNIGNVTLDDIQLTDLVPDVQVSGTWTGPLAPGAIDNTAFVATYALKQADLDAGQFANSARVDATGPGPGGTAIPVSDISGIAIGNDTSTDVSLTQTPSLSIVKAAAPSLSTPPAIGDQISYSFVVTNTGNQTLTNVVVTDPLPDLVMTSPTTIPTLLPGAANAVTVTATYVLKQSDIQAGEVRNRASAAFDAPGGAQPPVTSNEVIVPLSQVPGIALVKTASSALSEPAVVGEVITYSFTVTNTGNLTLDDVEISDPLPRLTPNAFIVGTLAPGQTAGPFTATYGIDANDVGLEKVVNQATTTGTYDDGTGPKQVTDLSGPTNTTNEPTEVPVVKAAPSLALVKTASFANGGGYTRVGDEIDYQFVVTNTGNVALTDVEPRELGVTFAGKPPAGVLEPIQPGPQSLAPGAQATFSTRYVLTQQDIDNAAGIADGVINTADATGVYASVLVGTISVSAPQDTAKLMVPPQEPANVSIAKRALTSTIRRGETASFVITVTNHSLADIGLVTITDRMPPGFVFVENSASVNGVPVTPTAAGAFVTFERVLLGPKSTVEIALVLRALPTTGPGTYRNVAQGVDGLGTSLAPPAHAEIRIDPEAIFDCSEVIGKVFNDLDRDGYQDEGEPGIPGARLATVRGTLITTDAFGRYSVPCADLPDGNIGSNFVLKLDVRTLPTGFSLTTDNPAMVRLTAGKMTEMNFGISIGREIRLALDGSAFLGGSTAPTAELDDGIGQLMSLLAEHTTTLSIIYTDTAAGGLGRQRLDHITALIRERWRGAGEPYRLVINADLVVER